VADSAARGSMVPWYPDRVERGAHAGVTRQTFTRRSLLLATAAGAASCFGGRRSASGLPSVAGVRLGQRPGRTPALAFLDDRYALSADHADDASACVWDVPNGRLVRSFAIPGRALVAAVSPDRERALIAGWSTQGRQRYYARLYDHRSGRELQDVDEIHLPGLAGLAMLIGTRVLAGYYDRGQPSGSLLWSLESDRPVRSFDLVADKISADGQSALAGSLIWNVDTGAVRAGHPGGHDWNTGLAIATDGRSAVTRGEDRGGRRRAFLWNGDGEIRDLKDQPGAVLCAAFSGDGRRLLTGATRGFLAPADSLLTLRDARSGLRLANLAGHTRSVTAIACSASGRWAISADAAGELFAWALS
jgi:WD40 repeat protein